MFYQTTSICFKLPPFDTCSVKVEGCAAAFVVAPAVAEDGTVVVAAADAGVGGDGVEVPTSVAVTVSDWTSPALSTYSSS